MGIASTDPVTGKPTFNDVSTTQADLQAAVDFAAKGLGETTPSATSLPSPSTWPGRTILALDTKIVWVSNGSQWIQAGNAYPPHARYLKTSAFPWPSTVAIHTWDATPVEGAVAGFTVSGGVQRFTITQAGLWRFAGALGVPTASGFANIEIRKNGTADARFNNAASSSAVISAQFDYEKQLAVNDYIEFWTVGSNLTGTTNDSGAQLAFLTVDYLHA
jgi:hypothetical protein